jgi:hypothetical protein
MEPLKWHGHKLPKKKMLKYVYIKKVWEHREQIAFNLAHKVAKKIIHAKWKKKHCLVMVWF